MKAVVATFNQEKALIGAFSVITNLRVDLRFKLYLVVGELLGGVVRVAQAVEAGRALASSTETVGVRVKTRGGKRVSEVGTGGGGEGGAGDEAVIVVVVVVVGVDAVDIIVDGAAAADVLQHGVVVVGHQVAAGLVYQRDDGEVLLPIRGGH